MVTSLFTILVLDDNPLLSDLVATNIELEGYQVLVAENGLEALSMLRSQTIHLMILDIMMPVLNGYEVLQQMKDDPELSRTPVIVMSALTDMDNVVRCIELGAEDCLFKPINNALFWARINAALEKKRLQDQERLFAEELATQQQLDRALNKTLDLEKVASITLNWALQQTGADRGAVGRWVDTHFESWAEMGGKTAVIANHVPFDTILTQESDNSYQLYAPIRRYEDVLLGLIVLESRWPFTDQDKHFLMRLCSHAAIAINNAQMHAQIQAANRAKTEFVAMVSHELKSPLTVMHSYLELFILINDRELSEKQTKFIGTMEDAVMRMNTLITELDDITRIETKNIKLALEAISLPEALTNVSGSLESQFQVKGQTCTITLPTDLPPLWADHKRLIQILHNLLSNAHKYGSEQGSIWVTARTVYEEDTCFVEVAVQDNGIGIPEKDQSKIFTQFYRTEQDGVTAVSGTGLGLNITKMLIELQGGKIWFTSKLNEGSTFYFLLPTTPSTQTSTATSLNQQSKNETVPMLKTETF